MSLIKNPLMYIADPTKGRPVFNGKIYIGKVDLDPEIPANQKQVYFTDESGVDIVSEQPVSISAGGIPVDANGNALPLSVQGDYSMKVLDKNLDQVFYFPEIKEEASGGGSDSVTVFSDENVTLASGQLLVGFQSTLVDGAAIYISGESGDRGRLVKDVDYAVTGASSITLFESYQAGTICTAAIGEPTNSPDFDADTNLFMRSLVHNLPFRDEAYNFLETLYGYGQIYPQGVAVDEKANEIIVMRGPDNAGSNTWTWFWIYDLTTGDFKTVFTAQETSWESMVIRYDGLTRWLYAIDKSENVYRVDISSLPPIYSFVPPSDHYPVNAYTQMTFDGNYFYVSQQGNEFYKGHGHRNAFSVFDVDFNKKGTIDFPIEATGTLGDDTDFIPKSQATTFHDGEFMFGIGRIFKPGNDPDQESKFQGINSCSIDGDLTKRSLCRGEEAIVRFKDVTGHDLTLLENEGLYSEGGNLYGLWVTLDSPDWTTDGEGVSITLELSTKSSRVDFGDIGTGLPAPFNAAQFQSAVHFSGSQLLRPLRLTTINDFVAIFDMMRDLNLTSYSFSGNNQVLVDGLGASVPTTGNLITCKSLDGEIFSITVDGPAISREYWFVNAAGNTQVIKNISFT